MTTTKLLANPVVRVFFGVVVLAQGLRMLMQFKIAPGSVYPAPTPSGFDWWFDWLTLASIGMLIVLDAASGWMDRMFPSIEAQ
jgi:hypothetical protein